MFDAITKQPKARSTVRALVPAAAILFLALGGSLAIYLGVELGYVGGRAGSSLLKVLAFVVVALVALAARIATRD